MLFVICRKQSCPFLIELTASHHLPSMLIYGYYLEVYNMGFGVEIALVKAVLWAKLTKHGF